MPRRRLASREWRLLSLASLALLMVGAEVWRGLHEPAQPAGYRRVDAEALQRRLRSGDLVRHEADFYRPVEDLPVPPGGAPPEVR